MRPVKATRDFAIDTSQEYSYYNRLQYMMTPAFAKHVIEKSTKGKAHKKIFELLERFNEQDRVYYNFLRS